MLTFDDVPDILPLRFETCIAACRAELAERNDLEDWSDSDQLLFKLVKFGAQAAGVDLTLGDKCDTVSNLTEEYE